MLELMRIYLGYCLNCRRPTIVGEFQLFGWRHRFTLCDVCIGEMQKKVVDKSVEVLEDSIART